MDYSKKASRETITKTIEALKSKGIEAELVSSGADAKKRALELIPKGAEVMNMTSVTVDSIGLAEEIMESGNYNSTKKKLMTMDRATQSSEMQKLGAASEWSVGSVHAVAEDGTILIASNSGSQMPGYIYGSKHVVWLVGSQKLVPTVEEGKKRIYEHTLPLESERARKAYGVPGSFVSFLLTVNRNPSPGRMHMIIIDEAIGY